MYSNKFVNILGLLLVIFWGMLGQSLAQVGLQPPIVNTWSGSALSPPGVNSTPLIIQDDEWLTIVANTPSNWGFTNVVCKNELIFRAELDEVPAEIFTADLIADVIYTDDQQNTQTVRKTFEIDFDPASGATFVHKSYATFEGGYFIRIEPVQVALNGSVVTDNQIPSWLKLDASIQVERYYDFDRLASPPSMLPLTLIDTCQQLEIRWQPDPTAVAYDLEWVYVDDYKDPNGSNASTQYYTPQELDVKFEREGVRVNLRDNAYVIDNMFDRGYVVFRVRAVGASATHPDQPIEGQWSFPKELTVAEALAQSPNQVFTVPSAHSPRLNWQYVVDYAEEGKHGVQLQYLDGSMRSRQMLSKFTEVDTAMITETIYDAQGRPAIQVLPASAHGCRLRYYANFNQRRTPQGLEKYDWRAFDVDGDSCSAPSDSMSRASGAARYYSPSNPNKEGAQAYLPDAHGYPFMVTEYMSDETGRIRRQGGAGPVHQLENRDSKYYYAVDRKSVV